MPYGEANIWWPVADALRHGAGIRSSDPADKAIELARTSVCIALGEGPPRRGRAGAPGPALPHGLRVRAAGHRTGPGPRGGHLTRWSPTRSGSRCTGPWWSCCPTSTGPTTSCSSSSTPCSSGSPAAASWCWPPPARSSRSAGTRRTAATTSSCSRSTRSRPTPPALLLEELAGPELGPELCAALLDRSGGNPFFLEELVTLLADAGMVGVDGAAASRHEPRRAARHAPRAWWRRASTVSRPTSGACSTTAPSSGDGVR